jgi:Ca2+-binding EF-hand superfamily protein
VLNETDMADFEEAFELFDKDGDGTISTSELKNLLRCFERKCSEKDITELLSTVNKNNEHDEEIDFEEFKIIMATIMSKRDYDEELVEMFKVFAREEPTIEPSKLTDIVNKLLE